MRGPTARTYLQIRWDYPVHAPEAVEPDGRTVARARRRALTREQALAVIAGDDPRPLLVLRECKFCNGTDDALLKGGLDNEKTFLLSRWFHCVKLPVDVLEADHPFRALFEQTDDPEHLFVSSVDGGNHRALESQTSRTELWTSMRKLLAQEYEKKPDASVRTIFKLLDRMDRVDERLTVLVARRDETLEEKGPKSRKLPRLVKQIAEEEEEREELKARALKAYEIGLKEPRESASAEQGSEVLKR